jgi:hypothetical protein
MITFPDRTQKGQSLTAVNRQTGAQELTISCSELELLVNKLHEEKTELLGIALHLSQAVTRMGNTPLGIDSYDQHNEGVAMAQKYQEDLQEWIVRNVSRA